MNNLFLFCFNWINAWHRGYFLFTLSLFVISCSTSAQVNQPELSNSEKIYGLSLIWMEVQRNFPFRERLSNFDEEYKKAIEAVSNAPDLRSYYRELQIFVAKLHDGHTSIRLPKGMYITRSRLPMGVTKFGMDAVVTWVRSDLLSSVPLGSVVLEIDGHPYRDMLAKGRESVSASTTHALDDRAYFLALEGDRGSTAELKLMTPDNDVRIIRLKRGAPWPQDTSIISLEEDPVDDVSFKWIVPNRVAYVALNSFVQSSAYENFLKLLPILKSANYIVLDLRKNSGGNGQVGFNILSHFLSAPAESARSTKIIYDPSERAAGHGIAIDGVISERNLGFKNVSLPADMIQPSKKEDHLNGKLLVLTGHVTGSAAEDFLVAAQHIEHIRLGEITAGSTGQPIVVQLPGSGAAHILSKIDTYPSGEDFVGKGIAPHIEIAPTLKDVRKKRDVVIEKALQLIEQGKI